MTARPLLIISLEGLATAGLGCYGSSWNRTPTIDRIASEGVVWDRLIATVDEPDEIIRQWWMTAEVESWQDQFRPLGSVELLTDDAALVDADAGRHFDQAFLIDEASADIATREPLVPTQESSRPNDDVAADSASSELVETRFGRLIASAIDRHHQLDRWSVLWLHSGFLTRQWDAPRELWPLHDLDEHLFGQAEEPVEDWLDAESSTADEESNELAKLPPIFASHFPPHVELNEQSDPDLVTAWMRTYGCQIRLVDVLLELLLESLRPLEPTVAVLGTSGFGLGQNGWIGHRVGPVRSCDIRLPLVMGSGSPVRSAAVTPSEHVSRILARLAQGPRDLITPADWVATSNEFEPAIVTRSARSDSVVTTPRWFLSTTANQQSALFLKPDDVDDVNEVSSRRDDVVDQLSRLAGQTHETSETNENRRPHP